MNATEQIPVVRQLFRGTGAAVELLGSRCQGCGTHYFPTTATCRNPSCRHPELIAVPLSRTGRLYSYTIQSYRPPPLFKMDDWSPYAIGLVDLPEGLRVFGMLTGCPPQDWRVGTAVELVTEMLYRDSQGREVVTYKFKPAGASV